MKPSSDGLSSIWCKKTPRPHKGDYRNASNFFSVKFMSKQTIDIDGQKFVFDTEKAKQSGLLKPYTETIRKAGQFYLHDDDVYILACSETNCAVLICLFDGVRWDDPIPCDANGVVSEAEWEEYVEVDEWKLISSTDASTFLYKEGN